MIVRDEQPADIPAIFEVNRLAFGRDAEAQLVDQLRANGKVALSLVVEDEGKIIGHILFSPACIETPAGPLAVMALGPLAVLPGSQHHGIGSSLVLAGLRRLSQTGARICIVEGNPSFYSLFGFVDATPLGITSEFEAPPGCFMVRELQTGSLEGVTGRAFYAKEFKTVG